MKLQPAISVSKTSAFSLVECLVYIAVLMIVTGIAFSVFFSLLTHHRNITRCSEDILRALKAGERWRADVRAATEPPTLETSPTEQALHIHQARHTITYLYSSGELWRVEDEHARGLPLLNNVKTSSMVADSRTHVQAWRWDLRLVATRKKAKFIPWFSFLVVQPPTRTNGTPALASLENPPTQLAPAHSP